MKTKTIFTAKFARELLRKGFTVVDIKPNNLNRERSVFVFELSNELEQYIEEKNMSRQKLECGNKTNNNDNTDLG